MMNLDYGSWGRRGEGEGGGNEDIKGNRTLIILRDRCQLLPNFKERKYTLMAVKAMRARAEFPRSKGHMLLPSTASNPAHGCPEGRTQEADLSRSWITVSVQMVKTIFQKGHTGDFLGVESWASSLGYSEVTQAPPHLIPGSLPGLIRKLLSCLQLYATKQGGGGGGRKPPGTERKEPEPGSRRPAT